ncbi:MAG: arylsulfatase [Lentisphaeria bacterium]|nr:arylsulfatase [Lentisphaeria bacterium]
MRILFLVAAVLVVGSGMACLAGEGLRPNIVVILADDFGYGSAGCYGADGKLVRTPSMDRLAREGRRFTDANTTSSVCSPTRYSLLTGRYCWRTSLKHEVLGVFSPLHIEPERLNLASLAKRRGYATAAIGKWHLGYGREGPSGVARTDYTAELSPGPLDLGFDYHFAVPANHGDLTGVFVENRFVYGLRRGKIPAGLRLPGPDLDDPNYQNTYGAEDMENPRGAILDIDAPRRRKERVMATLTDKAVAWLRQQSRERPFFLFFTPVAVHNPVTPDRDVAGESPAGLYGDWIYELDRSTGRILDTLDTLGIARDTLVLFTSDNGGVFRPENTTSLQTQAYQAGLKVNGDLRGGKHSIWEGGFKVPFLVRWPGHVPAGTVCPDMVSLVDTLATIAALLGETLPPPEQGAEDSRNVLASFLGTPAAEPPRNDLIVHSADGVFAIRRGPWKWVEGVAAEGVRPAVRRARAAEHRSQLYNLAEDPAESRDVSAEHPEVVRELSALLARHRDGGYSRTMPPAATASRPQGPPPLPPLEGAVVLRHGLDALPEAPWVTQGGTWDARDGGLWGTPQPRGKNPAALRGPLGLGNGAMEYEVNFGEADRHSLRIHTAGNARSFRVVISPSQLEVAKNPEGGETQATQLARAPLALRRGAWHRLRLIFAGERLTVRIGGVTRVATHAVFAEPKELFHLLVFEGDAGFRDLTVVQ